MKLNGTILLADDNEDHFFLFHEAFTQVGWAKPLLSTRSGDETKAYLKGEGKFADRNKFPYPVCLLLDLNMPETDGIQLLTWIREQPEHKRLLVFILTSDKSELRSRLVYDLAANSLLHKPNDFNGTVKMAESIKNYLEVIQIPPPPENLSSFVQGKE